MRVYVQLIYTVAVDVDHAEYDATTDDELIERCQDDPDFAYRISNGPNVCYDNDWRIPALWPHDRKDYDAKGDQGDGFEVLVRRQP